MSNTSKSETPFISGFERKIVEELENEIVRANALQAQLNRLLLALSAAETCLQIYAMTNKTFPEYGEIARDTLNRIKILKEIK